MPRLLLTIMLLAFATPVVAQSPSLDGIWLLFDDPGDPALAQLTSGDSRLPQDQIDRQRRIEIADGDATVHAAGTTVNMTLSPTLTEWGNDAQVSDLAGTNAPITLLRFELPARDRGTLTSYSGQTALESFAIVRVQPSG